MTNRELVYKSFNIIEDNLKEVTASSLSKEFGFSNYYFSQIFKAVTGNSLKEYILKRRISDSCKEIVKKKRNILDIALEYGFSTHETYSRAFQKVIGINPSKLRQKGDISRCDLTLPLTKEIIEISRYNSKQNPEVVIRDKFYLAGIPFYYDVNQINDLSKPWNNLISNIDLLKNRIKPEKYYQMQYWLDNQEVEFFYFFIALEVEDDLDLPMPFTIKEIPKQKYLKFLHKGKAADVGRTYDYIYNSYLPETEYKLPYTYNFEFYGPQSTDPYDENSISEIYIPIE